jgi:hypothetical protein
MPNLIAGVLTGNGNDTWAAVIGVSFIWWIIWIVWSIVIHSPWVQASVQRGMMDKDWGKARAYATALSVEYLTAVFAVLPVGCVTFLIKGWVTQHAP